MKDFNSTVAQVSIQDSDTFYSRKLFQEYFKTSPQSFLCKSDSPHFTILAVSDLGVSLVGISREHIIGRGTFEVFPGTENKNSGQQSVQSSFERVISSKKIDKLPLLHYEIPFTGT